MASQHRFEKGVAFIDNAFVPIEDARIPITDRGFLRSDATYDALHVWRGYCFRLDDHLERFERNVRALRLSLPYTRQQIREIVLEMASRSNLPNAFIQIIGTRGIADKPSRDPRDYRNRFYALLTPFMRIQSDQQQIEGMRLHISARSRIPPNSIDPRIKNFHWLDLTLGLLEAYDQGADLEVLTDGAGNVTEGPGFNIFAVVGGRLITPAEGVFDGMTRRTTMELAAELGIPAHEGELPVEVLQTADESFITTTAGGLIPITQVDRRPLGNGRPGPVTRRLVEEYWLRKETGWHGTAVPYPSMAAK